MLNRLIDTHIHIWDFDRAEYEWLKDDTSILHRNYCIEELAEDRSAAGVTGGVLVQAANNVQDSEWMLEVAEKNDWIRGVVGWLPLMKPEATADALNTGYASGEYFKGMRHLIHDEPDPKWLLQDEVIRSLQLLANYDLPYDVVGVLPAHIETALKVAEKIPSLRMVFDHLNQPPVSSGEKYGRWGDLMREAAQHRNMYMKISGLGTASKKDKNWEEEVKPYIEYALELFGEDRCFCGGDWPVCLLADTYTNTWQVYKGIIGALLSDEGKEKLFYKNAERFYKL